jgi:hypothetical protein
MVQAVRSGRSYRDVARRFRVGLATVALWVQRARGRPLERVDWADRPDRPHRVKRTSRGLVQAILRLRRHLVRHDALGEHGPWAIRQQLLARGQPAPCARTIARWLARLGHSGQERWRRPAPPKGWYLPELAAGRAEADSADVVEGLRLRRGGRVEVLNVLGLWGHQPDSGVARRITTSVVMAQLAGRWRRDGLPTYVQFDNDTIFSGAHARRAYFGRLVHWCLCLGVTPVFAPPAELGFQASIEAYNRRWQERVWRRWRHRSLADLHRRSDAFVSAYRQAKAGRSLEHRALRRAWQEPALTPSSHRLVLLRRLDGQGTLTLCAQRLQIAAHWAHRLVRCEINVANQGVHCFGLTRREPLRQPLLARRRLRLRLVPWSQHAD